MDDLGHGAPLVGAFGFGVVEDANRRAGATGTARAWQVAASHVPGGVSRGRGIAVEGVGEDPHGHAAAIYPETGAGIGRVQLRVPLGGDRTATVGPADDRGQDLGDATDSGHFADRWQIFGLGGDGHGLVAAADVDDILEIPGLEADSRNYFRDVYDHAIRISDQIDSYRDLLAGTRDAYLSVVSNRLNQITKQLTVVATIFLPLSFIVGFFGQNFKWLVVNIDTLGDFLVLGIGSLVLSVIGLLFWFRRGSYI